MNVLKSGLLAATLLLMGVVTATAQMRRGNPNMGESYHAEFELRRWRADLGSELRLSGGGVPGTTVDPAVELGLPAVRTWDYHFAVRLARRFKVRGNWFETKYEGDATPGSEICIGGLCVPPGGGTLSSNMDLQQLRGGVEFDLVTGEYGFLAVIGEYARFDMRTQFQSGGSVVVPDLLRIELPMVGLRGRAYLTPALAVTLEGAGMKKESEGVMTDVDAFVTYNLIPSIALSYGYRNSYNRFKAIEPDGDRAVVRLRGQYFGVTVRF